MQGTIREVVILSAARTPIGRFQGGLAPLSASDLGGVAIREALRRAGATPDAVDEVLMGHVLQGGTGQAPARQAALKGGLPDTVAATTVNKVCGSGLKAVMIASQPRSRPATSDVIVAGGMESMSNAPYFLPAARTGYRLGNGEAEGSDDPRRPLVFLQELAHGNGCGADRRQVRRQPRGPGRVRGARASRRRSPRSTQGSFNDGDRPGLDSAEKGRSDRRRHRRGSAAGRDPRGAREAQAGLQGRRHGHRGQRIDDQRRRRGARPRLPRGGGADGREAASRGSSDTRRAAPRPSCSSTRRSSRCASCRRSWGSRRETST